MTTLEALKSVNSYPIPLRTLEEVAQRRGLQLSNECTLDNFKNISASISKGITVYGRIPLMVSANCIDKTCHKCHKPEPSLSYITDRKGVSLPYVCCCRFCYNVIYNNVPVFLTDKMDAVENIAPANVSLCFTDEDEKEVINNISMVRDAFKGVKVDTPANFTRGHFTRGVE